MISSEALEREMERIRKLLGSRIREARERRELTLADVEERTGVNRATLSRLENGEHSPRLLTVVRVGFALGLEPADLLNMREPKERKRRRSRNGGLERAMKP